MTTILKLQPMERCVHLIMLIAITTTIGKHLLEFYCVTCWK